MQAFKENREHIFDEKTKEKFQDIYKSIAVSNSTTIETIKFFYEI